MPSNLIRRLCLAVLLGVTLPAQHEVAWLWWEYHEAGLLRLWEHRHAVVFEGLDRTGSVPPPSRLKPGVPERQQASAALLAALDQCQDGAQRDLACECLKALARIGTPPDGVRLLEDVLQPRLAFPDQEVRDAAALAIGIAGHTSRPAIQALADLAFDRPAGRKLVGDVPVVVRTRAFAIYGLGLLLRPGDAGQRHLIVELLIELLRQHGDTPDLGVAALHALSLLPRDDGARNVALQALRDQLARKAPLPDIVLAHVPTAVARLLSPADAEAEGWRTRFAAGLAGDGEPRFAQSCAIALGMLCRPWDDGDSADAAYGRRLLERCQDTADDHLRVFAAVALGRMGGAEARDGLLAAFTAPEPAGRRGALALALGVWAQTERGRMAPGEALLTALRAGLGANQVPFVGDCAVALGLYRDAAARPALLELLKSPDAELAGRAALGLGMLGDRSDIEPLRVAFEGSSRRPDLRRNTALARAMLHDGSLVEDLCAVLQRNKENLAQLSAASIALGLVGDRCALPPVEQLLADRAQPPLKRALLAVALGLLADPAPEPWNVRLANGVNWNAAVPTLTDRSCGVLDQL